MSAIATPHHRVSVATARVHADLDAVADASVWSMDPTETAHTLAALERAEARLAELKARVAAHADELHVGRDIGAASAANWLAHHTKTTRAAAHASVRLGRDLETHPRTRHALAAGDVLADQARVIIRWVDRLTDDLDPETPRARRAPSPRAGRTSRRQGTQPARQAPLRGRRPRSGRRPRGRPPRA